MHRSYDDMLDRLPEPNFYQEGGIPRFEPFQPGKTTGIHSKEAVLAEIACQGCGTVFKVAFERDEHEELNALTTLMRIPEYRDGIIDLVKSCKLEANHDVLARNILAHEIETRSLHYGDPPNIGCCPAGPTMNSEMIRILEYWRCNHLEYVDKTTNIITDYEAYSRWQRFPHLEIDFGTPIPVANP